MMGACSLHRELRWWERAAGSAHAKRGRAWWQRPGAAEAGTEQAHAWRKERSEGVKARGLQLHMLQCAVSIEAPAANDAGDDSADDQFNTAAWLKHAEQRFKGDSAAERPASELLAAVELGTCLAGAAMPALLQPSDVQAHAGQLADKCDRIVRMLQHLTEALSSKLSAELSSATNSASGNPDGGAAAAAAAAADTSKLSARQECRHCGNVPGGALIALDVMVRHDMVQLQPLLAMWIEALSTSNSERTKVRKSCIDLAQAVQAASAVLHDKLQPWLASDEQRQEVMDAVLACSPLRRVLQDKASHAQARRHLRQAIEERSAHLGDIARRCSAHASLAAKLMQIS